MSSSGTLFNSSIPDDEPLEDEIEAPEDDIHDPEAERIAQIEAEARRGGWRPQEEYRGPPGQWRTAEEFLKRGQDILPMVRKDLIRERERGTKMEEEIKALRQTVDEQKLAMDDLLKMARTASESGYKRALEELKAKKRQAAQAGDIAGVVAIDDQISEVEEARADAVPPPREAAPAPKNPQPVPPRVDPAVERFVSENPWFNTDQVLHKAMETEHMALLQDAPGLSLEENLDRAKEAVMARYPRKFGITEKNDDDAPPPPPRRNGVNPPSPPSGGGRRPATGIASIEDPQERAMAQQAFNRTKRQIPDITEVEWFAIYQNPKADIMDIRQAAKTRKK